MFADESLLYEDNEIYGGIFNDWRVKRVKKIENVFGRDWFKNKNILEMGCAFGNVGLYLKSLGANVTFSDARQEALDAVKQRDKDADLILLDQEKHWFLNKKFDLILHFGLLYNLDNWERDLYCTMHHAKYVALETAVARFANKFQCKITQTDYSHEFHGPYSGTGSLVSSANIEEVFKRLRARFKRYDDKDLNLNDFEFCYDWPEQPLPEVNLKGTPVVNSWWSNPFFGGRRFWVAENKAANSTLNLLYRF